MELDYDFKANLTTVLSFVFLPILSGLGVDSVTGMAFVGVLVTILIYVFLYFNEKYISKYFTKHKADSTDIGVFESDDMSSDNDEGA